jgi:hypothetical protein
VQGSEFRKRERRRLIEWFASKDIEKIEDAEFRWRRACLAPCPAANGSFCIFAPNRSGKQRSDPEWPYCSVSRVRVKDSLIRSDLRSRSLGSAISFNYPNTITIPSFEELVRNLW